MLIYLVIVFVVFLIGILRCRVWAYWKWAIVLAVWTAVWPYLFAGGGTLEDPSGDGLITGAVRIATQDGPQVALFGLAAIVAFWAGIVFFVWRMIRADRTARNRSGAQATHEARLDDDGGVTTEAVSASPGRKGLEIAALCAGTVGIVYLSFAELAEQLAFEAFKDELAQAVADAEGKGADPVALVLQDMAAGVNTRLPEKLDAITIYDRVTAKGRTFTYYYRLTREGIPDNELAGFVQDTKLPKFCRDPRMRHLADDYDVAVRIGFDRPDRPTPYMVDLDPERCGFDAIAWQLRQAAADLTADLPEKVDGNETLEFVTAEGRTLVYHYRLAVRDISDAELVAFIRAEDVPRLCADPDTRDLFDNHGVTFRFSYVFPDSVTPVAVDTDAAACREADKAAAGSPKKTVPKPGPRKPRHATLRMDGLPVEITMQDIHAWAARKNTLLPEKLDAITTLERVSLEDRAIVHHYRLSRRDEPDAMVTAYLRMEDLPRVCADSDLRHWIDTLGITIRYSQVFPDSTTPLTFDIDAAACARSDAAAKGGGPDPVAQYVEAWAADDNAGLPEKFDKVTTLERASADGRTLIYHYRLKRAKGSDEDLISLVRNGDMPRVCAKADIRHVIDTHGVTLRYRHVIPGRDAPLDIDIHAASCREVDAADAQADAVEEDIQALVAELNADLPEQVDETMTFDRVSVRGRKVVYHYSLTHLSVPQEKFLAHMYEIQAPEHCGDSEMRELMDDDGVTLRYSYRFPDRGAPLTVDIGADDCRGS